MSDTPAKDALLVQYLNEANSKEKELVSALTAHIGMSEMADRKPYKKKLQEHLRETKNHSKALERRIKKLGGRGSVTETVVQGATKAVSNVGGQAVSAAKGPLHTLRGTSGEEKLLKNAKTEYWNEHEEIATYMAIETLAEEVGDKETAKLARDIRRDEEKMARYLERLIPTLTKALVKTEVPAAERRKPAARKRSGAGSRSSSGGGSRSSSGASSRSNSGGSSRSRSTSSKRSSGSSGRTRSGGSRKRSTAKKS
ncbi:MAG: ferritin-like domain-containing protein [Actinomycetota bacterium]|nr:ferritin-like domain-containing protein [Actinomycetota bacterium]